MSRQRSGPVGVAVWRPGADFPSWGSAPSEEAVRARSRRDPVHAYVLDDGRRMVSGRVAYRAVFADTLNDVEKTAFARFFYALPGAPDDLSPDNPRPWGMPWLFGGRVLLEGRSLKTMAERFLRHEMPFIKALGKEGKE